MSTSEAVQTRWNHSPDSWKKRLHFADILGKACAQQGVALKWLDDEKWAGVMCAPSGRRAPVYGYDLGLNPAAAAKIADSKADTYALLRYNGIPAILHERITPHVTDGTKLSFQQRKERALARIGLPMVLKPDAAHSGGKGIELCKTEAQVLEYMEVNATDKTVTASPYKEFDEYRVVVLDGKAQGVIQKQRDPRGWMHNHSKGAEHALLDDSHALHARLGAFGVESACALDLRFTTVDVAHLTIEDELAVLEANDAVSIVYPNSPDMGRLAHAVYADATALRLGM